MQNRYTNSINLHVITLHQIIQDAVTISYPFYESGVSKNYTCPSNTYFTTRMHNPLHRAHLAKLQVMLTMEAVHLQNAIGAPLPPPLPGLSQSFMPSQPTTDDEQLSQASLLSSIGHMQVG